MSATQNVRQYRYKREIITDDTEINITHLIRSLPFDTKSRLCTIRKNALFKTLSQKTSGVRKSYGLKKLLDIAKEYFHYDKVFDHVNTQISKFQKKVRIYLSQEELRLIGPGIPVSRCVNDDCPYTMETLTDIPQNNIFTWKDNKIYGCQYDAIFNLLASKLESSGKLYIERKIQYESVIENYERYLRQRRRRFRNPLREVTNPFTRQVFDSNTFRRVLQIAEKKGLFVREPQNRRIRQIRNIEPTTPNYDSGSDSDPMLISIEVSELLRTLDYYTPETIVADIITHVATFSANPTRYPRPVSFAHSRNLFRYVTERCVPIFEHLSVHFNNSYVRNSPALTYPNGPSLSQRSSNRAFINYFRRGRYLNELEERATLIQQDPNDMEITAPRILRYFEFFLNVWSQAFGILLGIMSSDVVEIEDKKSVALFIIVALAQTGHLREGFEWAIDL